jgi:hypothetical protein
MDKLTTEWFVAYLIVGVAASLGVLGFPRLKEIDLKSGKLILGQASQEDLPLAPSVLAHDPTAPALHEGMSPCEVFPGKWQNSYSTKSSSTKFRSEVFEIKDGNQYWVDDRHIFDIAKLRTDPATGRVTFVKVELDGQRRIIEVILTFEKPGKLSGIETGNGPARKVKYKRIA